MHLDHILLLAQGNTLWYFASTSDLDNYGGTAILYRKSLISKITRIQLGNPRITAVILQTDIGPVLFVSAYTPCDYGNAECHENFIATCANITALFAECDALHIVVAGDFNCHYGSRFYDSFVVFANDNDLIFSDINLSLIHI